MRKTTSRRTLPSLRVTLASGFVVLSVWSCAANQTRDTEQADLRFQIAADDFKNHRLEAALEELQKARQLDPQSSDVQNLYGLIALQQGAQYMDQVDGSTCLRGNDAEVVSRDATQKFRDAERSFRAALTLRPEFPEAWNNLSVTLLQLRDWDGAIDAARNALKNVTYREPELARANLGWAYFQKRDLPNAWKELREAAARAPAFCVGHYRLAKVYVERGQLDLAAEELNSVVARKDCPIQEAVLLAGMVHSLRKEPQKAQQLFARCATMAPRSCTAAECKRLGDAVVADAVVEDAVD